MYKLTPTHTGVLAQVQMLVLTLAGYPTQLACTNTKQLVWGWSDACRTQVTCVPFNLLVVGTVHGEAAPRFVQMSVLQKSV